MLAGVLVLVGKHWCCVNTSRAAFCSEQAAQSCLSLDTTHRLPWPTMGTEGFFPELKKGFNAKPGILVGSKQSILLLGRCIAMVNSYFSFRCMLKWEQVTLKLSDFYFQVSSILTFVKYAFFSLFACGIIPLTSFYSTSLGILTFQSLTGEGICINFSSCPFLYVSC